jgi:hypothetical protein
MVEFMYGIAVGILLVIGYGYIKLQNLKKERADLFNELHDKADELQAKRDSIVERLKQASEIGQKQLDLRDAASQPSKNQLHSKYKNGLVYEIQELEQQKAAILQSIINDGFDPSITIMDEDGERKEMKLSEFLGQKAPAETPPPPGPKRVGKLVVLKGGKDDGNN